MTVKEKLNAIMHVQDYEVEIKNKLEEIIKRTYDSHCYLVDDFIVGDEFIDVTYSYTCRGYSDTDYTTIPRKWLDEGFDYKAAYEEMKRKAEEEYEQYLKLKDKYEKK